MAQTEDTKLKDVVMEALERNGSLAKVRALLRANVFRVFEDEEENLRQNVTLDNIAKMPEGILSLTIVHEFLEYCNLQNTLYVYMSESKHDKDYIHEGQKMLNENFSFLKRDIKEPTLISILRYIIKHFQRKHCDRVSDCDNNYKDDQSYIVYEDSTSSSNSHSDNSLDEKNKLHLRLQLDNSDTDTSSDSAKDKMSSEYIPNEHIIIQNHDKDNCLSNGNHVKYNENEISNSNQQNIIQSYLHDLKNTSSDSTSYVELKSFKAVDENFLNTVNTQNVNDKSNNGSKIQEKASSLHQNLHELSHVSKSDSTSATLSNVSSISSKSENVNNKIKEQSVKSPTDILKNSDSARTEYSYDFTKSSLSSDIKDAQIKSSAIQEKFNTTNDISINVESHKLSHSSQSSVSASDVADLIEYSERHSPYGQSLSDDDIKNILNKKLSNKDSSDSSESIIPSLSNLSLDIRST